MKSAVCWAATECILVVEYLSLWKLLYVMLTDSKHFTLIKWYLSTKPHGAASEHVAVFRTMAGHCVASYCIDSTCLSVPVDVELH